MEVKYYTPEIEEFHVGFEFEVPGRRKGRGWIRRKFQDGESAEQYCSPSGEEGRVKYLDREDIESLGFKLSEEIDQVFGKHIYYFNEERKLNNMSEAYSIYKLVHQQGKVLITRKSSGWVHNPEQNIFYGKIANRSELKHIFKLVGIIKNNKTEI